MSTDTPNEEPEVPEVASAEPEVPVVPEISVPETSVPKSSLSELKIGSAAASTGGAPALSEVPVVWGKLDRFGVAMGTGRRKTAVARVRIKEGSGGFIINGRALAEYFVVERDRAMVMAPIELVGKVDQLDVTIRVNGGGTTGQTGAVVLGIGRALQGLMPETHYDLAAAGYLTRDSRMVERKKYGLRKARRAFQFSKR